MCVYCLADVTRVLQTYNSVVILHGDGKVTELVQVNLFKKGLGVGVPGNQHDKTYAQGEILRQIVSEMRRLTSIFVILFSCKLLNLVILDEDLYLSKFKEINVNLKVI